MLLEIEYYTEKEAFRQQTESRGVARSVKRGDAWMPVRVGKSYYNSLNQLCIEVFRTADQDIEHNFEFGRPVQFFRTKTAPPASLPHNEQGKGAEGSKIAYYNFTGTISYVDGDRMVVAVPDSAPIIELQGLSSPATQKQEERLSTPLPPSGGIQRGAEGQGGESVCLGVQLSFDETSYRTMFDALDRVMRSKNNRLAELRDLFYTPSHKPTTNQKPTSNPSRGEGSLATSTDQLPEIKAHHFSVTKANLTPLSLPWLNPTQEQAVNEVLRAKDVAIVHGPPGTGKTTTLVEAIVETLHRESQVLVCAQSNMAVDWISERLVDRGVNVLRIGNPTRVNDKMLSFTYERRFEDHPDYELLWAIRKAIRDLRQHRKRGTENWHQKMNRLRSRATELEIRINAELFGQARVIASTLVGSANRLLEGQKYRTLFIDEAAQALEAACWIPIRRVSRVVFAGDHCQLPPTVKSLAALKAGLGRTLMERLVENHPEAVTLLGVQYRMNEEIMRFSSDWFYGGKVVSAPQVRHRSILDYDVPMEWRRPNGLKTSGLSPLPLPMREGSNMPLQTEFEHGGLERLSTPLPPLGGRQRGAEGQGGESAGGESAGGESASSFSLLNKSEATLTLEVLRQYLTKISKTRVLEEHIDVGIISPYRAQVQYLRSLIKHDAFFKPYRKLITVNTVDGFQGQERDIIIISLVRSNDQGQIGFLRELRRMNVAITRARMKLIILGDPTTMCHHPFYRKLYQYIQALNSAE